MSNSPITGPCPMLSLGRCETRMVDNATLLFGRSSRPSLFRFLSAILLFCIGTVSKSFSRFNRDPRYSSTSHCGVRTRASAGDATLKQSSTSIQHVQIDSDGDKFLAILFLEIARCVQIAAF